MQTFDVIVVGAGLVGASLALALADAEVSVAVVDPRREAPLPADDSWDSRVYAISPGNAAWLGELGIWDRLPPSRLQRIESMRIFGDRAPGRLDFGAYEAGLRELAWIVENRVLQGELASAVDAAPHVTLVCPGRPSAISWAGDFATLSLEDGATLQARLIVGADGAESWVRQHMGVSVSVQDYQQVGVVANFETARAHEGAAFQWFRPDGVLALLPLPGRRVSMVWSAIEPRAQQLLAASPDELVHEIRAASADVLGALTVVTSAAGFPLRRQRVDRLIEPRGALVGDAAHNVHPLAGQGVNLGFRDARQLAQVLRERGAQRDCGDYRLLRRYERARSEDIAALDLTTDGLEKLFGSGAVWLAGLRNLGLALVDAQPLLKNMLVRHASA
jgi:ubiquinone biosynthesis UbiH/UbiF/VisC/COQ6 family hydroxylase